MLTIVKFEKKKIVFAIVLFITVFIVSIWYIIEPEIFVRNFLMKPEHILIIGTISFINSITVIYSLIYIFFKDIAIIISEDYLEDYSKYESLGKIHWDEVIKIKKIKKTSLEITLKKSVFERVNISLLKRFLLFMWNWNYGKSIIISSALLDCSIDELEKLISTAFKNYKDNKK